LAPATICLLALSLLFVRQAHTQGNSKNNERKQHRNKTQIENMQSVTTRKKKGSEPKKAAKQNYVSIYK
jgi:hypothetical protein